MSSRVDDVGAIGRRAGIGALALSDAQAAAEFFRLYGEVMYSRLRQFELQEGNVQKVYSAISQRIVLAFHTGNIDPKDVTMGLAIRIAENAAVNFQRFGQPFSEGEFLAASPDELATAFLKRYRGAMLYGMNLQGVPEELRNDLFQDISLMVLRRYRRKPYDKESLTLAVTIARNASRDFMSRRANSAPFEFRGNGGDPVDFSYDLWPDHDVMQMEIRDRLHACIALLTPLQRRVIKGQLVGRSLVEMAKEDRVTEERVKQLAHRARVKLRQLLGNPLYR